jgi:hypothetical protein
MKRFILNTIIFIVPILLLINLPKLIPLTFHEDLNRKINTLIEQENLPDIIIGGDSRAERHLKPLIFEDRLGLSTVNIAVNSGDISMLYSALKKHDLINKNGTLIISVSSIEMNDQVINKWGIPHSAVSHISFFDNIRLFNEHYLNMLHERLRLIFDELFDRKSKLVMHDHDSRIVTKGFLGIKGDISEWDFKTVDLSDDTLKVGWYINAIHNGVRKELFNEIIKKMSKTEMNIILFQPPTSPSWYNYIKNTYIDSIELDHSQYLKNISAKYSNISFIDFYTNFNTVYDDSMFYNSIHFNYKGAELFTNMFIDSLIVKDLIEVR